MMWKEKEERDGTGSTRRQGTPEKVLAGFWVPGTPRLDSNGPALVPLPSSDSSLGLTGSVTPV